MIKKINILASVLLAGCIGLTACAQIEETEPSTSVAVETEAPTTEAEEDEAIRVCILYDSGMAGSIYMDACKKGAEWAEEELEVEVIDVDGSSEREWKVGILKACEEGCDLIIAASSNLADYVVEYAPEYPEMNFAVLDTFVNLPNVQSICFALEEGYFLAGETAAMHAVQIAEEGSEEHVVIGWVGGINIPIVHNLFTAYEQGAKHVNPDVQILQEFSGEWEESQMGVSLVESQFQRRAAAVMYVPFDVSEESVDGVAVNCLYMNGSDAEQSFMSVEKQLDVAVYRAIQDVVEERFCGGSVVELSVEDGGIVLQNLTDLEALDKEGLFRYYSQ